MGTHDLIDAYLAKLRGILRHVPQGETAAAEVEDHLLCATEELEASGTDPRAAQELALARFGPVSEVAEQLARGPQFKPAVPTRSTQSGGTLLIAAAGLWLLYALTTLAVLHLYERLDDNGDPTSSSPLQMLVMIPWAGALVGGMVLILIGALVLKERHGGFRWAGWIGLAALGGGCVASLGGWFIPGWGSLLFLGTALLAVELLRAGIAPRKAALVLPLGPAVGFAAWGALRALQIGSPDQYGDYPAATSTGVLVGCTILAASLAGLGRWLGRERPLDRPADATAEAVSPA